MSQQTRIPPLRESHLPGVKLFSQGKVRDVYEASGGRLLVVATDRLSAFDVVMAEPIPDKGRVLTQLSCFWFGFFESQVPHHFLTASFDEYPPELAPFRDQLEGRSMLVKKAKVFPVECVARGFLTGSGLKDYNKTGQVCGIPLPPGLRDSDRLPQPILFFQIRGNLGRPRFIRLAGSLVARHRHFKTDFQFQARERGKPRQNFPGTKRS